MNSRPLKEDWQDVPSTVKEIMRLKKEAKTMPRRRKKKKNHLGQCVELDCISRYRAVETSLASLE